MKGAITMISALVSALAQVPPIVEESLLVDTVYTTLHLKLSTPETSAAVAGKPLTAEQIFGRHERLEHGWIRGTSAHPGFSIFAKAGLHIAIPKERERHGNVLALPAIRDHFTPGFSALLSSAPIPAIGTRIYFSTRAQNVPHVGRALAETMHRITDRFVVKAANRATPRPRSDAFTVFVGNEDREKVLRGLAQENLASRFGLPPAHSLFTQAEPGGLSWMEGRASASSGVERASCAARAYIKHLRAPAHENLSCALAAEFAAAGINPELPHLYLQATRQS